MPKYKVVYYDYADQEHHTVEIEAWDVKREDDWTNLVEQNGQLVWSRKSREIMSIERIESKVLSDNRK